MRMREFTPKEFVDILTANGWVYHHHNSNHYVFSKEGYKNHITVNFHNRTMNRPMAKRLLKEAGITL